MTDRIPPFSFDGIARLTERRNARRFAPLAQIEAYWDALRGAGGLPSRSDIKPRGLEGVLEQCFVLERIAPGLARMRIAGAQLSDVLGMEVRGMPLSAFVDSGSRERLATLLEEVFQTPAIATADLAAETGYGRPALSARLLLLPVKSDLGDVSRILGGLVCDGRIGRTPRRFRLVRTETRPVLMDAPHPEQTPYTYPAPEPSTALQAAEPDAPRFESIPGAPHLRLVKG